MIREINELKKKLNRLMEERAGIDDEILELSQKIDKLITAYYIKKFSRGKVM